MTVGKFLVSSSTEAVLDQGRQILWEHYGGEPFGWRTAGPSLRSLAEEHGVSLSAMYRCVSTSSIWIECGSPELEHTTISHLRELLAVGGSLRPLLLQRVERQRWTVARLRRECDAFGDDERRSPRRGRPRREPGADFVARTVHGWLANADRLESVGALRSLSATERARLLKATRTMLLELEMVCYRLE